MKSAKTCRYLLNSKLHDVGLRHASREMTSFRKTYVILFSLLVLVVNQKSKLLLKSREIVTIK